MLGKEWIVSLRTGDYQVALQRHSEEAAKYHLKVQVERARLGKVDPSEQGRDRERAYRLVKEYFDQQIASLSSTGPTRLDLVINEQVAGAPDPHEILVNLDSDLADTLAADNEYANRRERELVDRLSGGALPPDLRNGPFATELARLIRDAMVEIAAEERAHFLGEATPVQLKRFSRHPAPVPQTKTFGDLADDFYRDVLSVQPGRDRTMRKHKATLAFLKRHFGTDTSIADISRSDAMEFRDLLSKAPRNAVKLFGPDLSLRELVKKEGAPGYVIMGHATQTTYLEMANRLFGWAVEEDLLPKNPARRLLAKAEKIPYEDRRDPYTLEELTSIFSAPVYTGCVDDGRNYSKPGPNIIKKSRFWMPLIALFTGMRPEEILQLTPEHVGVTKAGTPYLALTRDMKLKTKGARREIPIHPTLLAAGFMKFVEDKRESEATVLFDDVPIASDGTRSGTWSKRYATFSKSVGVKADLNCFYSFRHNFRDAVRAAEIPEEQGEMLQGWSGRSKTTGRGYGNGFMADQLAKWIAVIEYDGLDLSHVAAEAK